MIKCTCVVAGIVLMSSAAGALAYKVVRPTCSETAGHQSLPTCGSKEDDNNDNIRLNVYPPDRTKTLTFCFGEDTCWTGALRTYGARPKSE